jgi:sugar/nucleoside kinase (ribokinase family)
MAEVPTLDVISVGDANIDLLMKVPHHPDLDPNGDREPGVRGSEYHLGPGGVAANMAAVMAQLGHRVGFTGVIGDDDLGRTLRQNLMARGIDLRYLRAIPGYLTSLLCCLEDQGGQAVFYSCPGPKRIPADCLAEEYLASARLLFIAGNMLTQDEMTGHLLVEALRKARRQGVTIAVDPSKFWLNLGLASYVRQAIAGADILLPNAKEAELLTGCASPLAAARALLAEGPRVVSIKLGEAGCVACSPEEEIEMPAFRTQVRAYLGAGDAFNGGFLHGYLRRWPLKRIARFANATASLKLRHPGTQAGLPTEAEVEAFLSEQMGGIR